MKKILRIDASANASTSASKMLGGNLAEKLQKIYPGTSITQRDLNQGLSFVDAQWVDANATPADQRTREQQQQLTLSDTLIAEIQDADRTIVTTPMYNFGVPATLKAWIDLICRAGVTFQYTSEGPIGLLKNKQIDIIITTGGVPLQSPVDFVSDYLKQVFRFIGIEHINIISADQMAIDADTSVTTAQQQIDKIVITTAVA
ncbi:MAG: FMN-dependent NADH-azoreductase [Gammaproteobacteria bacterium]|jgi:FMN-dependent NADH-azoreductase